MSGWLKAWLGNGPRGWVGMAVFLGVVVGSAWAVVTVLADGPSRAGSPEAEEIPNAGSTPEIPKLDRDSNETPTFVVPPAAPLCELAPAVCKGAAAALAAIRADGTRALDGARPIAVTCGAVVEPDHGAACQGRAGEEVGAFKITVEGKGFAQYTDYAGLENFVLTSLKAGPTVAIGAVGCAQTDVHARPDCAQGFALTLIITTERGDKSALVVFSHATPDGTFALFGAHRAGAAGPHASGGYYQFALPGPDGVRAYYFQRWADQANP